MVVMRNARVVLADNGEALGPIVVSPEADRVTLFAASELVRYLEKIDHKKNGDFLKWLKGWIQKMSADRVGSLEYYGWQMEMTPLRRAMQRDIPAYRDLGLGGVYGWTGFGTNLLGDDFRWALDAFLLTHLLWNPGTDVVSLKENSARGVFGDAAQPVLDLHEYLEDVHEDETQRGLASNYQWIEMEVLHNAQQLLKTARRKTENGAAILVTGAKPSPFSKPQSDHPQPRRARPTVSSGRHLLSAISHLAAKS